MKTSKQERKTREAKPPAKFIRSLSGTPARLRRTCHVDPRGRWLYRLDFGNVVGSQEWTLEQLVQAAVRWLKIRPRDLPVRQEVVRD